MESIEKASDIKEIEKQAQEIVKISLEEKPKKVKKIKKHFFVENDILAEKSIKGDFDKKTPIQNIKSKKKTYYKPFVSEIQEEKSTKIEDLQKEIDNQKKALELRIKESKEEKIRLLKEEKIRKKAEKKEQKAKQKAEKRERRRKHWYFRMFMRKEKPKEILKEIYSNPNEIKLIESNDTILKICPLCFAKIKKQKVIRDYGIFRQLFKCKKCNYSKEIVIKI